MVICQLFTISSQCEKKKLKSHLDNRSASRTRDSGPVFELADLQHALAVLPVEDVWCCNVIQGVVLQGRRSRVKLGVEGQRVGGAVSRSRADCANSFGGGLHGNWRTFVKAILFGPGKQQTASRLSH